VCVLPGTPAAAVAVAALPQAAGVGERGQLLHVCVCACPCAYVNVYVCVCVCVCVCGWSH